MNLTDNKLFNLLKSFSAKELNEFKKMTASPIYTGGRNYLPFLKEILKILKKNTDQYSSRELYSKIYPDKEYSSQTLKNRFSEMFKLCEDFIVYNKINSDSFEKEKFLLPYYLDKKLFRLFENKYVRDKKELESQPDSENKYRNLAFLNIVNINLLNKKNKKGKMYDQYYDSSSFYICNYLIQLFQFGIEYKTQEYDNETREFNLILSILDTLKIDDIIEKFKNSDDKFYKVVCMFYYLYKAYENPEEENNYYESKKLFGELSVFFEDESKTDFYKVMITYCIMRQNAGIKKFQFELFDLYNEKLNQGLYQEFRQMMYPINTFRDYVYIGLEIGNYHWVDNFIKKYYLELPEETRDDEYNLSYAKLYYQERHFNKSLTNLNQIKGNNYIHYLDSSLLKLIIYFELDRLEDSFLEIDKLRHYIRNHKEIPVIHKEPNLNFVKLYQRLIKLKSKPDIDYAGYLANEINSIVRISRRDWLIEKVSE